MIRHYLCNGCGVHDTYVQTDEELAEQFQQMFGRPAPTAEADRYLICDACAEKFKVWFEDPARTPEELVP